METVTLPTQPFISGLYCVATPIGNLGDITLRALSCLHAADAIYAEDTRQTRKLLTAYNITTPHLASYHEHSSDAVRQDILARIKSNEVVVLVSDSGTPLISDPGYRLVTECREKSLPVFCLPGANAAVTALVSSGLPTHAFSFVGFIPPKQKAREKFLGDIKNAIYGPVTVIAYEAPTRLLKTLQSAQNILGDTWQVCVARELTKKFEEVTTLPLSDLMVWANNHANLKGEMVVAFHPPREKDTEPLDLTAAIQEYMSGSEHRVKDVVNHFMALYPSLSKKDVYRIVQDVKDQQT